MFKMFAFVLCLAIITASTCGSASNLTKLHLLGLFPMTGPWAGGETVLPATQLAVKDINANSDILPGYEIVMIPKNTEGQLSWVSDTGREKSQVQCDGGKATDVMYRELYNTTTTKIMIIGDGCSVATEPTAQASHHWNLIQISYASSSPKLSNRAIFPLFFRLLSPESAYNIVKLAMFREFNWRKVATLHESVPLFAEAIADFHRDAEKVGVQTIVSESFLDNPFAQVKRLKDSGARIIVGGFYSNMARKVFCAAYKQRMYGAKYVWIVPGWMGSNWWRAPDDSIDCTLDQMEEVTANHFDINIDSLPSDNRQKSSKSGLTTSKILERYRAVTDRDDIETLVGYTRITLGYDSVWTAALTLHEAQKLLGQLDPPRLLEEFAYDSTTVKVFFDIMSNMTFDGVSGPVKFTSSGDRLGLIKIRQIQDGQVVAVGIVDPVLGSGEEIIWEGYEPIIWQGGAPPIDFIIEREDRQTIQLALFITGAIFAITGIALACCFLAFNITYRKIRVIKMSSPNINNLMLIGGILSYISIIFLGIDTAIASTETFVWMCKAKTWCLSIGFSMAFGSMFSKTWRVHKIFTSKTAMKTVLKDYKLMSWVASLVFVDVLILILWEVIDPVKAKEHYDSQVSDENNDDIVYIPIRMMCESANQIYFIGAFYVIDGLLLIFGAFLAWETRKVSILALNDSKYIGVSVYNVLILSFIGAPVSFVLGERNAHFALVATLVWLATTLTLCVVFVPKVRMRNDVRPAQSTIGPVTSQSNNTVDSQKQMQQLRREIMLLKKNCKCSANSEMTDRNLVTIKSEREETGERDSCRSTSVDRAQTSIQGCSLEENIDIIGNKNDIK